MGKSYVDYSASVIASRSYDYNGCEVQLSRNENGIVYVNLTEVAKAFPNKNLTQIVNSQEIKEYCESLSKLQNYSLADLLIVKRGGNDNGTWAHQKVALRVAQKLSPDFAVMVDSWIEELLTTGQTSIRPLTKSERTLATIRQLCELAERDVELERKQIELEQEQKAIARKVSKIEETIKPNGFMSVMGFANIHHINIGTKAAASIGRLASKWCKTNHKSPERVKHERWGEVNTYPMEALKLSFAEFYPQRIF